MITKEYDNKVPYVKEYREAFAPLYVFDELVGAELIDGEYTGGTLLTDRFETVDNAPFVLTDEEFLELTEGIKESVVE